MSRNGEFSPGGRISYLEYRALGSTGLLVSEIGLGCEGLNGKDDVFTNEMFEYALS